MLYLGIDVLNIDMDNNEDYLRVNDAAKLLGVSTRTIHQWTQNNNLASTRPGGERLWKKTDLNNFKRPIRGRPKFAAPTTAAPVTSGPIIPPVQEFVGIYSAGNRFYKNADEAYIISPENARRMWWDLSIMEPLQARILATAQLPWHIEPEDKTDEAQSERAKQIQKVIEDIPGFLKLKIALSYAIWFGKAGVQIQYVWQTTRDGQRVMGVKEWSPVHGDSIYWKFDKPGEVGILIGQSQGPGTKQLTWEPTDVGPAHVLTPVEREAFIIHTYLHLSNDWYRYEKAGQVNGVGLRDSVYWVWWLKNETQGILQEFIERVGLGITIWRYEASNQASLDAVKTVAENNTTNCQIFYPYMDSEKTLGGAAIQRIEPSAAGVQNIQGVIEKFEDQIKRLIAGQNLTSESDSTGLGSNLADVHENTFMRLVALDATNLAETMTHQLVRIIHRHSFPEDDFDLKFVINVDKPDPVKYLEAASKFYEMGGELDEDEVRSVLGFSRPEAGNPVLKKADPLPIPGQPGGDQGEDEEGEKKDEFAFPGGSNTFVPGVKTKKGRKSAPGEVTLSS